MVWRSSGFLPQALLLPICLKVQHQNDDGPQRGRLPPILDWSVDSEAGHQTVARAPSPQPHRWRPIVIASLIALGILAGVLYRLMSSPPAQPSVTDAVDRESRALAEGNLRAFIAMQDPSDNQWQARQLEDLTGWQTVSVTTQLYNIIQSGTLPDNRAWADVNQFRNGQYFRQLRFYRLDNDHWVRIEPVGALSGAGEQTVYAQHFELVFHEMDHKLALVKADRFEALYSRICVDLGCPTDSSGALFHAISLALVFDPVAVAPAFSYLDGKITMPSPGIHGEYFNGGKATQPSDNSDIDDIAFQALPGVIARVASGGPTRWSTSTKGDLLVGNIGQWEQLRLQSSPMPFSVAMIQRLRASKTPLPLEGIWDAAPPYSAADLSILVDQTWAFITFVERDYGAVGIRHLLMAIGPARSLSEAIETGLNVKYADFQQQWQDWLMHYPDVK